MDSGFVPSARPGMTGRNLPSHAMPLQRTPDLIQNRRVVDGGRHDPGLVIGDLLDGAAENFS